MDNTIPLHASMDASVNQQAILVVDARPMRQFYIGIFLQRLKYQVIMAMTAEDAVLFQGLTVPLFIIANYDLPHMTGLDLLIQARRDHRTRGVPFIIYTSNRSPDVQHACEDAGCSAFLRHPCSLEDLYATVEATLKRPRRFLRLTTAPEVEVGDNRSPDSGRGDIIAAISEQGMFVNTAVPLSLGEILPLTFYLPNAPGWPIRVEGRCCSATSARTSERSRNGCEIPEDRRPGVGDHPGGHQAGAYEGDRPGAGQRRNRAFQEARLSDPDGSGAVTSSESRSERIPRSWQRG